MFPVLNNFSETPCMKVGLDVRISLVKVLSTGGGRGIFPPNVSSPPPLSSAEVRRKRSPLFVDISGCVAAVVHRNFIAKLPCFSSNFSQPKASVEESTPPQKKVFPEKNEKLFQILILFDDDIKESVKATNVQKCNFSQSWTLPYRIYTGHSGANYTFYNFFAV